jgi:hypothetical protein
VRIESDGAHLSVKELLDARQALLPVDALSRLGAVYRVSRDGKDDRWDIVVMEE